MRRKEHIALDELKEMLPYLLGFNGVILAGTVAFGFVFGFDWRVYTGLAAGNALMALNFYLIGFTAEKVSHCREPKRGQFIANLSYGLRYVGIFVILALLLTFGLINPYTALIPLFFTKIYYTFIYIQTHREDDEQ